MSDAKIRIKIGSIELEYEGDPSFLTGGIEGLLTTVGELAGSVPEEIVKIDATPTATATATTTASSTNSELNASTNTIAAHLGGKSGPELIMCAVAQLELVQKKAGVSRSEILEEMKGATSYYNKSMGKNIGQNLSSLTKAKRLNHLSGDRYALTAAERESVEAKVADIA